MWWIFFKWWELLPTTINISHTGIPQNGSCLYLCSHHGGSNMEPSQTGSVPFMEERDVLRGFICTWVLYVIWGPIAMLPLPILLSTTCLFCTFMPMGWVSHGMPRPHSPTNGGFSETNGFENSVISTGSVLMFSQPYVPTFLRFVFLFHNLHQILSPFLPIC